MRIEKVSLSTTKKKHTLRCAKEQGFTRIRYTMSFERDNGVELEYMSYDTLIATLKRDTMAGYPYLFVNWEMFDCSNTTIHQFSGWLRSHNLPDYNRIKKLSKDCACDDVFYPGIIFDFPDEGIGIVFV